MDPIKKPEIPDEHEIEDWLSRFKPRPTARFFERMRAAPWNMPKLAGTPGALMSWKPLRRVVWGIAAVVVLILIATVTFIPPVRAIARQIIFSFISAPSNQIEVQVTLTNPGDLFHFSDPSNFSLSLEEAQQQAGYSLKQIYPIPEKLKLIGARFDKNFNTVIFLYQSDQFTLFLTQRPLGHSQDVFSIGQEAVVTIVKIGDVQGEFVRGGWKAISTQAPSDNQTPEKPINITAIWDNSLPQSTLRWQVNNMVYELRTIGEFSPSQSELIQWANELK